MKRAHGALLVLLLGGLLAEVAVRLMGGDRFGSLLLAPYDVVEPITAGMRVDPESTYLVFDPDLGWQVGPNRQGRNGLYHSDASGQRRSNSTTSSTQPWATAFGDSFTHGDDVGDEDTWLARLGERGLPTINLAVPGYGVDQAWLRYRKLKDQIRSRVVLIGVMADNIGRHVNRYRPFITPTERIFFVKPRFERSQRELVLLPSPFRDLLSYARLPEKLTADLFEVGKKDHFFEPRFYESHWLLHSQLFRIIRTLSLSPARHADWRSLYEDTDALDLTVAIVEGFVDEVRRDHREPVLVFLPERSVARDVVEGRTPPTAVFLERLRRIGCPLIDLTVPVARFAGKPGGLDHFLPHYSPALSEAVADSIIEWKRTEKSFP